MLNLLGPPLGVAAQLERGGAVGKRDGQRAVARRDVRHLLEPDRQPEVVAPELQHVGLETRLAGNAPALELHGDQRFTSHCVSLSGGPRAAMAETARSHTAASSVESTDRWRGD